MAHDEMQEFLGILESFDHAMLVTQREAELRSRPMAIADRTAEGHVWFITSVDSAKLQEITDYPDVNVAMQAGSTFLSISGTVRATRDPDRINELWNDVQELWFPEGRNDPTLILLEVVPTYAEYWDRSGVEAVKFAFDAAKSMATGHTLTDDEGKHAKLDFPDRI
jgi:general stress protein 26